MHLSPFLHFSKGIHSCPLVKHLPLWLCNLALSQICTIVTLSHSYFIYFCHTAVALAFVATTNCCSSFCCGYQPSAKHERKRHRQTMSTLAHDGPSIFDSPSITLLALALSQQPNTHFHFCSLATTSYISHRQRYALKFSSCCYRSYNNRPHM